MRLSFFLFSVLLLACQEEKVCESPDYNGYIYDVVNINGDCWFAENLRTRSYSNGEPIPMIESDGDWENGLYGMHCFYNNADELSANGQLYNFKAVADYRGLCPSGWHVPSDLEWQKLEAFLGMDPVEIENAGFRGDALGVGSILKARNNWHWCEFRFEGIEYDTPPKCCDGTDEFGFGVIPSGYRRTHGEFVGSGDYRYGEYAYLWSSTPTASNKAWGRNFLFDNNGLGRYRLDVGTGCSVRCVQDSE